MTKRQHYFETANASGDDLCHPFMKPPALTDGNVSGPRHHSILWPLIVLDNHSEAGNQGIGIQQDRAAQNTWNRERGKTVLIFEKNKAPAKTEPQNPTPCALEPGLNTVVSLVPKEERTHKTISLVSRWLDKRGSEYVRRNIEYTNQRSSKQNGYQGYLANAFEQGWAEDRPHQTNGLPDIEEGMVVEYEGAQYRIDATGCIFLPDGACMPPGLVRQKLDMGKCRVVVDTSGQTCS